MFESITLDGRLFHSIKQDITANQDDYILAHLRLAGAIEVLHDVDGKKRTQEERAEDLLTRIMLAGKTSHVLAGVLTEDGKTWTRAEADANAAKFSAIKDVQEKLAMRKSIVEFVIGFFSLGEPSSETSQKSSSPSASVPPTKSAAARTSGTSRR